VQAIVQAPASTAQAVATVVAHAASAAAYVHFYTHTSNTTTTLIYTVYSRFTVSISGYYTSSTLTRESYLCHGPRGISS